MRKRSNEKKRDKKIIRRGKRGVRVIKRERKIDKKREENY